MTQTAAFDPVPSNLATLLEPAWLARALSDIGGDDRIVEVEALETSRTRRIGLEWEVGSLASLARARIGGGERSRRFQA